jgi:tripartite-type tricarboxylate transporter receptor subunit TctC
VKFTTIIAIILGAGFVGLNGSTQALAAWPERPITVIVPFAAGGGADPIARRLFDAVSEKLGQNIVIDFRPGAGATIGGRVVATAAPDGYTLLFTSSPPIVEGRFLKAGLPYDPDADLIPIVQAVGTPIVFTASANFAPNTFEELVEYGKANQGEINAGISGLLSLEALAVTTLKTGVEFNVVPYGGYGSLLPDLMSGTLDIGVGQATGSLAGVKAGKLKYIASMAKTRPETLSDIPTTTEAGYEGINLGVWFILFAPKGTPTEIIDRLNAEVNAYIATDEGKQQMAELGQGTVGGTPQDAADQIKADVDFLQQLVDTGFKMD